MGHDGVPAEAVRHDFKRGFIDFDTAMRRPAGFYSAIRPRKNKRAWASYLTRTYKQRWSIETGFRMLNSECFTPRYVFPQCRLADIYSRAIIYNLWQARRLELIRKGRRPHDGTYSVLKRDFTLVLRNEIIACACNHP